MQSSLLTLVSSISVTSIHGSHPVSHGDYESQNFFQLTSQCVSMVEGSLVEHKLSPFLKDSLSLFCVHIISQYMFQIIHFMVGNPLNGIFLLGSHPVSHIQVHMCMGGSSLDCSFPDLPMYLFISLSHYWAVSINSSYCSTVTLSRMDFMVSGPSLGVSWLRASAAASFHPFWYSMLKVNLASYSTQQCQVASRLGVVTM